MYFSRCLAVPSATAINASMPHYQRPALHYF
jgi:hypothetical protein